MENILECGKCDHAQLDRDEHPCNDCKANGNHFKPQTQLTKMSIQWDGWLEQKQNQRKIVAAVIIGVMVVPLIGLWMMVSTIRTVARLTAEVHSLTVDMHQMQERARGR